MSFLNFAKQAGILKKVKRSGWVKAGIKNPESVAEHSYRLAILAMIIGRERRLDTKKLVKMALLDDLAESIVGDLVTEHGDEVVMDEAEKFEKEDAAIKKILSELDDGEEYYAVWKEAQEQKTPESKLLKELDKLEMVIQAQEYEQQGHKNLEEFWTNATKHITDAQLIRMLDDLTKLRKKN